MDDGGSGLSKHTVLAGLLQLQDPLSKRGM
jgi:hypothetical protein